MCMFDYISKNESTLREKSSDGVYICVNLCIYVKVMNLLEKKCLILQKVLNTFKKLWEI